MKPEERLQTNQTLQLGELYASRLATARAIAASGRPVIGVLGPSVPRELITACGAIPYDLEPQPVNFPCGHSGNASQDGEPTTRSRTLLGAGTDAATAGLLHTVLEGEYRFLSGILISSDRESHVRIQQLLRVLAGQGKPLPPAHLVDVLHLPRQSTKRYNVAQFDHCIRVLEDWTGSRPLPGLPDAIEAHEALRAQLRAIGRLRSQRLVSGRDTFMLDAIVGGLPPQDALHIAQTEAACAQANAPVNDTPLFLSGSRPACVGVYDQIEASGWIVVGEDHNEGQTAVDVVAARREMPGESAVVQMAAAYGGMAPLATAASPETRAAWTRRAVVESSAEAVLIHLRSHDEAPAWDVPAVKAEMETSGIPSAIWGSSCHPRDEALRGALQHLYRNRNENEAAHHGH
jgi:hypothetical protein